MSHSVNIKTEFKNISNLLNQFQNKGWNIVENQTCNTYPSDPRRNEIHRFVARNPRDRGYDIGIQIDETGNAFFVCDFFDPSIEQQLGKNLVDIRQGYALDELHEFMQNENLGYQITKLESGELVVTAEG